MKTLFISIAIIIVIIGLAFLVLFIAARKRRPKETTKGFTPLEKSLLETFYNLFDDELSKKLKAQIAHFEPKRKWRQYWEKSMSIEFYTDHENPLTDTEKFNRNDEHKLATIRFKVNEEKYSIEFNSYERRLWGWKIRPNPKRIQKVTSVVVTSKKVHTDPNSFAEILVEKQKLTAIPKFSGWLQTLVEIQTPTEVFQPIKEVILKKYSQQIDARLPKEYLEVIKQTEGINFKDFHILGISDIRTTGLDDRNYYHLAEFDDGIIAVKEGETNSSLYSCQYSGTIEQLDINFSTIILEKQKNETV
ncbi:hypothetical protein [uncultured Kordia sp.]|uniref:hypothetical protein n=1 Tax=uncultured Kordia sp. TaxID=507699 RepID=UPI002637379B|nr:hypothetical protein [uncultured Kordia sp.]